MFEGFSIGCCDQATASDQSKDPRNISPNHTKGHRHRSLIKSKQTNQNKQQMRGGGGLVDMMIYASASPIFPFEGILLTFQNQCSRIDPFPLS